MQIRGLKDGDIPEAVSLWNEAFRASKSTPGDNRLTESQVLQFVNGQDFLPSGAKVAVEGGDLKGIAAGYIQVTDPLCLGRTAELPGRLVGIAVKPSCQGKGIGEQLLAAVERALAAEGKLEISFGWDQAVALTRGPDLDAAAYRFFVRRGYIPCAMPSGFVTSWIDLS